LRPRNLTGLAATDAFRPTSGFGTFWTWRDVRVESAFGGEAEVGFRVCQVSF
jgi:hypothetical protein